MKATRISLYKSLTKQRFCFENLEIVPLRFDDRFLIMHWRNEQIYHLRQSNSITAIDQNQYFETVVADLFEQEQPSQLLFSFLKNEVCIGYGGLVHINWIDKNAEISFIMDTELEKEYFHFNWKVFLSLIEKVAFEEIGFHKIFTYAFDLRPHLYEALESAGYEKEATLKEHCRIEEVYRDVIIHSKLSPYLLRSIEEEDISEIFEWSNDETTRSNSFNSKPIEFQEHSNWFYDKMNNVNSDYYIVLFKGEKAAFIRFDVKKNLSIIGVNISPRFRGMGLSSIFLKLGIKEHKRKFMSHEIEAYIKPHNISSIKAFERAGFKFYKKDKQNDIPALIFKYK